MTSLSGVARDRTELGESDVAHLSALVAEWSLIADLGFSDLVLWLPTWNEGGFVAAAQVRPTTGATSIPDDVVGRFSPRGENPAVDKAWVSRRTVLARSSADPLLPADVEAVPVVQSGRVLAVIARHAAPLRRRSGESPSPLGELEQVYLRSYDDLAAMIAAGGFPYPDVLGESRSAPRVGDGVLRLDIDGVVEFASPNAVSAFHRLGLAVELTGAPLASRVLRLRRRPAAVDDSLALIASGAAAGEVELDGSSAVVAMRGLPLESRGEPVGALVLVRDVTDLRRRDRALLSKDATIREIHHRVKNNLQTVASLLRLQARRIPEGEARDVLNEAVRRVGAIAVVHEVLAHAPGETVDFDDVTSRVVAMAADAAGQHAGRVEWSGSVGLWPAERATPLAMALTELLMNAVEHGLGQGGSRVVVTCERGSDHVTLTVADDGPGFAEGGPADGLGLQIVRTLVTEDLRGTLTFGQAPGGQAVIVVPVG